MTLKSRLPGTIAFCLTLASCASSQPSMRQECLNPDQQLAAALADMRADLVPSCWDRGAGQLADCGEPRRKVEQLAFLCPTHVQTLLTSAVMAYQIGQTVKAQQVLDRIFEQPGSHPDAAILRTRIALEEGNIPFARRLLEQQIKLAPDHEGLRETYAAALYLGGNGEEARRELTLAGSLGGPRWRIAYHLGLIEEEAGRVENARRLYAEAVAANPDWGPAQARLKGLGAVR